MAKEKKEEGNSPTQRKTSARTGRVTKASQAPKQSNTLSKWLETGLNASSGASGPTVTDGVVRVPSPARRPAPVAAPPAWADNRPALCDALGWFRALQSGCYYLDGLCYGFLLDADSGNRPYIDDEVIITRLGGACEKSKDGEMKQTRSHDPDGGIVSYAKNTRDAGFPVGLIIGNQNTACPSEVPHKYNVLDFFRITHVWFEKNGGFNGGRIRLEKMDLDSQSWWAPQNANPRPPRAQREVNTPAAEPKCVACEHRSPQVYDQGWMCLNPECKEFWKMDGSCPQTELTYNPAFLDMRSVGPANVKPTYSLSPDIGTKFGNMNPLLATVRSSWRGIVCSNCKSCIPRVYWEGWKCETEGCPYQFLGQVQPIPVQSVLQDAELGAVGHRAPYFGKDGMIRPETTYMKNYRKDTYELPGVGVVNHFSANMTVNNRPGGPNDLFQQLQVAGNLGLKRYSLSQSQVSNTLTCHFAVNYGMPYKYVVDVSSRPFSEAPDVLLSALGRLTWAAQNTVKAEEFQKPNELLTLGYFENMKIGFHDDGEESLGPTIATLSLGANAKMNIRMKEKYFKGYSRRGIATEGDPVLPGSAKYEERAELARKYREGELTKRDYDLQLKKIFDQSTKKAPPTLAMQLHHGDLVVMHGENLQKYYEHEVRPDGAMRFALTARYIKPEFVPASDHYKGDFTPKPEFEYDGDE